MDKRGDILIKTLVFVLFNLLFFAAMFYFVGTSASNDFFYEKAYAKQIALMIDAARPGMSLKINLSEVYSRAEKNGFEGAVVQFDFIKNKVHVQISEKRGGFSFIYFTKLNREDVYLDGRGIIEIKLKTSE